MKKCIAICIPYLLSAPVIAGDPFEHASSIAYDMISQVVSSPPCHAAPANEAQKQDLIGALGAISTRGLSDEAGLTPLDFAVMADDVPSIERLVSLGYRLDTRDIHGGALMHGAALHGSENALSFLLANGADPNVTNTSGFTPLMVAVSHNRNEIARQLLAAGASAAHRADAGATVLHYAFHCGDQDLVNLLLATGAPVDARARELGAKFDITLPVHER